MQTQQFGPLRARLSGGVDGRGGGDGPLVVLLHGYGAPGDDLVPLGRYLRAAPSVRFLFPEAPLALDYGRAWWPLDPELFERRARGERIDRTEEVPEALSSVREQLLACISEAAQQLAVPASRMLLGGFSQGSMLACDVALHAREKPAGLVLLSSTLLARSLWEPQMQSLARVPVLLTHGRSDPLLAHADAVTLRELLQRHGADVTFVEFEGGHEIPPVALEAVRQFIAQHAR